MRGEKNKKGKSSCSPISFADEAHNMKNSSSVRYRTLMKLASRADRRLMLTGTPLQNNINELWSLLNFLMPDIFGVAKEVKDLITWPEHSDSLSQDLQRLQRIISPFILRRLKSEVKYFLLPFFLCSILASPSHRCLESCLRRKSKSNGVN
jgi:SNF2 family DNA or RNA helicase